MLVISFKAKLDEFVGGMGYKVPTLTNSHVTDTERDMYGRLFTDSLRNREITHNRLRNMLGDYWPGVVWADESKRDARWTVAPQKNGFMAQISITLDPRDMKRKVA